MGNYFANMKIIKIILFVLKFYIFTLLHYIKSINFLNKYFKVTINKSNEENIEFRIYDKVFISI